MTRDAAMTHRAHVALGGNVGDRTGALRTAVAMLGADARTTVVAVSRIYETAPVGGPPQGDYLNAVALVETRRDPRELLRLLLDTETAMGRVRGERWGPRLIDLDLILYEDAVIDEPGLAVPHPRARERRFVLAPLADVDAGATFPDGTTARDALAGLPAGDPGEVRVVGALEP